MKRNIFIALLLLPCMMMAQKPVLSYFMTDRYAMIPKQLIETGTGFIIPYDLTKNEVSKIGLLYLDKQNKVTNAFSFEGDHTYAVNNAFLSSGNTLLMAAEGISPDKQESFYFLEVANGKILNSFIFNEQGNELDPFAIVETAGKNILVGGFIKNRELISSTDYSMYKEDQFIYYGEFSKTGKKLWANGINFDGYEKGTCNKVLAVSDGYILLCHAHKINGNTFPFIIKTNKGGDVVKILNINQLGGENISAADIILSQGTLYVAGNYKKDKQDFLYTLVADLNIANIKIEEFGLEFPVYLSSIRIEKDELIVCGSAITKAGSYDNLVFKKNLGTSKVNFVSFGTTHFDRLIGSAGDIMIGNSYGVNKDFTSSLTLFNDKQLPAGMDLARTRSSLITDYKINYSTIKKFGDSKMNKGIGMLRMNSNSKSIISN